MTPTRVRIFVSEIEIASFRAKYRSEGLVVEFTDGHRAVWNENLGGLGESRAIESFYLFYKGSQVVLYHSPHQVVNNTGPAGFVKVTAGYSLERIISYWQAAYDHIRLEMQPYMADASGQTELYLAWSVVRNALKDLEDIKAGKWPLP